MKISALLVICGMIMSAAHPSYAHPNDSMYVDLLNSKSYTLKLQVENKELLDSLSIRTYEELTIVEDEANRNEAVDIVISDASEKKQYTHKKYIKSKDKYYGGIKKGNTLESVSDISLNSGNGIIVYDSLKMRERQEFFKINKSKILRYLGPIYVKTEREPSYKVKFLENGNMKLNDEQYYYEEYTLENEEGARLRLLYQSNNLKRILKILTRNNDADFIFGVQREQHSFLDVTIKEFSRRLDTNILVKD